MSIEPRNLTAQLHHRAAGNPPSTLPDSAISNCFPGLEFDFRNLWRRVFEGIEVHEASGFVVRAEGSLSRLEGRFLLSVAGVPNLLGLRGPTATEEDASSGIVWLEWSNFLADVCGLGRRAGAGEFFDARTSERSSWVRPIFARSEVTGEITALIDEVVAEPGELTQSLCSPWQNDYRECGCYYWAASRPDYVNVEPTGSAPASATTGWRGAGCPSATTGQPQQPSPAQLRGPLPNWQGLLRFIVEGRDHD